MPAPSQEVLEAVEHIIQALPNNPAERATAIAPEHFVALENVNFAEIAGESEQAGVRLRQLREMLSVYVEAREQRANLAANIDPFAEATAALQETVLQNLSQNLNAALPQAPVQQNNPPENTPPPTPSQEASTPNPEADNSTEPLSPNTNFDAAPQTTDRKMWNTIITVAGSLGLLWLVNRMTRGFRRFGTLVTTGVLGTGAYLIHRFWPDIKAYFPSLFTSTPTGPSAADQAASKKATEAVNQAPAGPINFNDPLLINAANPNAGPNLFDLGTRAINIGGTTFRAERMPQGYYAFHIGNRRFKIEHTVEVGPENNRSRLTLNLGQLATTAHRVTIGGVNYIRAIGNPALNTATGDAAAVAAFNAANLISTPHIYISEDALAKQLQQVNADQANASQTRNLQCYRVGTVADALSAPALVIPGPPRINLFSMPMQLKLTVV